MKLQLEGWVGWARENEPGISKVKKTLSWDMQAFQE